MLRRAVQRSRSSSRAGGKVRSSKLRDRIFHSGNFVSVDTPCTPRTLRRRRLRRAWEPEGNPSLDSVGGTIPEKAMQLYGRRLSHFFAKSLFSLIAWTPAEDTDKTNGLSPCVCKTLTEFYNCGLDFFQLPPLLVAKTTRVFTKCGQRKRASPGTFVRKALQATKAKVSRPAIRIRSS